LHFDGRMNVCMNGGNARNEHCLSDCRNESEPAKFRAIAVPTASWHRICCGLVGTIPSVLDATAPASSNSA